MAKINFRESRDRHGNIIALAKVRVQFEVTRSDVEGLLVRYVYGLPTEIHTDSFDVDYAWTREGIDELIREELHKDGSAALDYGGVSRDPASDWKIQVVREFVRKLLVDFYPEFHAELALEALELSVGNQMECHRE